MKNVDTFEIRKSFSFDTLVNSIDPVYDHRFWKVLANLQNLRSLYFCEHSLLPLNNLRTRPEASVSAVATADRALGLRPPSNRFKPLDDFSNMVPRPYHRSYASSTEQLSSAALICAGLSSLT